MYNQVIWGKIGHREQAVIEPKGFWPSRYPVTVVLIDEPGNRRIVVTLGNQKIEEVLPKPHDAAA